MPEVRARRNLRFTFVLLAVAIIVVAVTGWQASRTAAVARKVNKLAATAEATREAALLGCYRGNKVRLVLTHLLVQDTSPEAPGFLADPELAQQPCATLYPKETP